MKNLCKIIIFSTLCKAKNLKNNQPLYFEDEEEVPGQTASQAYNALWMASIWWEAGYQQGKKEKNQPTCNDIRKIIDNDDSYTEEMLPNCNANGNWLPLQCNSKNCWCTFIDSGLAIQSMPHVARNESIICPKKYLLSKNPCKMNLATGCTGPRASVYKWVYDESSSSCKKMRACSGFDSKETCETTCAPEPLSLCTLPLNEGNCSTTESSPTTPGAGSLARALSRKRFYFNKDESKCMEFTHGRCGGNSNSFVSEMHCTATCLKDTMMAVKILLGNSVMDLNIPAWLALRLKLSKTEPRPVPENQLTTIFQYSKILPNKPDQSQGKLIEDNDLSQRSGSIGRETKSLLYPRCVKEPYKGPCKALEYRWSWSTTENGCVVYPFGGCVEPDVDLDGENTFDNKMDCILKCAPIRDGNDKVEVASYLVAGDDEKAPQVLLPPPSIPERDMAMMRANLNIPGERGGYQLPNNDLYQVLNRMIPN